MKKKQIAWLLMTIAPATTFAADTDKSITETWIAFIPVIIFTVIVILVFGKLWWDSVSLKDLLQDKDTQLAKKQEETKKEEFKSNEMIAYSKAITKNAEAALSAGVAPSDIPKAPVAPRTDDEEPPKPEPATQSVSRLLAFISGLVSVGLACSITTYYMWASFNKITVDIDKLSTVLMALGIGVIPYGVNKAAGVFKKPTT